MAPGDSPKKATSTYPEPLIVRPLLEHRQTFIILHGRGSNAETFAPPLFATELPDGRTLQAVFPHAKFIFPTASKRRARIYKRSIIHQWFDCWSLTAPAEKEELMLDGLRETSQYIHTLLMEAIKEVGPRNVVIGGLSQGCAATLIALLAWEGEPLAAAFGMCGWLPLRHHMADIVEPRLLNDNDDDLFGGADNAAQDLSLTEQAVEWLREEIDLPTSSTASMKAVEMSTSGTSPSTLLPFQQIPTFLAHGTEDEKVPVQLGRDARDCLVSMEIDLGWREYEGLGHWYSGPMLGDLVEFLVTKTEFSEAEVTTSDDTNTIVIDQLAEFA